MPEYIRREDDPGRILLEDGTGAFLLETSPVAGTVSGGGDINASGTATHPGEAAPVVVETAGGNMLLVPPRRRRLPPRPIVVIRSGSAFVTGGGTITAIGHKQTSDDAFVTAATHARADGYKSSEIMLVRYAADGRITRAEPVDTGPTLEQELQRLVEDALVLAEALN